MGNILQAVKIMRDIANDASHGYDQDTRTSGTDFDCSSLVTYALNRAGFNITYGLTTHYMLQPLKNIGYKTVPISAQPRLGDIFLNTEHHVCMVVSLNPTKVAEASHNERYGDESVDHYYWYHQSRAGDQLQHINELGEDDNGEIRIRPYYVYSSGWDYHLTLGVPQPSDWISGNRVLTESERENNATIIYTYFYNLGYSINAICAMLGNFEYESYLCPDKWEDKYPPYQGGYGLIQWTPYTLYADNYSDWHTNHNRQLDFINSGDVANWIPTGAYPLPWNLFKISQGDLEYLTKAYFYERERGTWSDLRITYANKWFKFFEHYDPTPPVETTKKKGYNFVIFNKRRRNLLWKRQNFYR